MQIGFNRAQIAGIYLPGTVTIGGTVVSLTGTELGDNSRGFLSFGGPFTGSALTVSFNDGDPGRWVFVDEVRIVGAAVQTVPEPSIYALLAAGLAGVGVGVGVGARRRRSAS